MRVNQGSQPPSRPPHQWSAVGGIHRIGEAIVEAPSRRDFCWVDHPFSIASNTAVSESRCTTPSTKDER